MALPRFLTSYLDDAGIPRRAVHEAATVTALKRELRRDGATAVRVLGKLYLREAPAEVEEEPENPAQAHRKMVRQMTRLLVPIAGFAFAFAYSSWPEVTLLSAAAALLLVAYLGFMAVALTATPWMTALDVAIALRNPAAMRWAYRRLRWHPLLRGALRTYPFAIREATVLAYEGELAAALAVQDRALAKYAEVSQGVAQVLRARLLVCAGKSEEALVIYRSAATLDPHCAPEAAAAHWRLSKDGAVARQLLQRLDPADLTEAEWPFYHWAHGMQKLTEGDYEGSLAELARSEGLVREKGELNPILKAFVEVLEGYRVLAAAAAGKAAEARQSREASIGYLRRARYDSLLARIELALSGAEPSQYAACGYEV